MNHPGPSATMSTPDPVPERTTRAATSADRAAVTTLWQDCGLTRPWNDPVADFDRAVAGGRDQPRWAQNEA